MYTSEHQCTQVSSQVHKVSRGFKYVYGLHSCMNDWHVRLSEEHYHKMTVIADILFNDDGRQGKQARALKRIIGPVVQEKYQEALLKKEAQEKLKPVEVGE